MGSIPILIAVVLVALLAVGVWVVVRRALAGPQQSPTNQQELFASTKAQVFSVYRGDALAAAAALILGGSGAAVMCLVGSWWGRGYGITYALAGGVGALVGLLVYMFYPRPAWVPDEGGRVVAELSPRGPTSFARQWVFVLPLSAAIILILGLLLTGSYSATDENGLHRVFQRRSLSGWGIESGQVVDVQYNLSANGPFPGWYYGVPVIICTLLLIAVVYWALHRTARAARPGSADLLGADSFLRSQRTMFIMSASSAALASQVAGLAAITGTVLAAAHRDPVPTADLDTVAGTIPVEPGHTFGLILILVSLVIAVAAVMLLIKACSTAAGLWSLGGHMQCVRSERVR
ncbi:hypothetical protein [Arthrobacter burdickii]|uniref:Uncharacterized protein n=1 Tax=Arthrobacter burdickii TaxID=3035920 RepID=A0ABT8JWM4_9MICC|nr:hypothetical protein [Arthrobacter burdickii]MDN4609576.1 hypothetical protein [Arthrobacter burdickii]